jgi:ectoine hydroxylase-related dioxygenase (phytanoyl-CoA dioxygenase family)
MATSILSDVQVRQYHKDGFVLVPKLFDDEEIDLLRRIARANRQQRVESAASRRDAQGGAIKLEVHNDLPDDIEAAFVRCRRIVDAMEVLLGDEVYHWHHKMILKEPRTGGAWEWHQDYGYWYNNGCLAPELASCMIAVDRATRANGCLQVLRGSHHLGRIDHGKVGDQTGADLERVQAAMQRLELIHCELDAGSAIFFHSNLLHCSAQNTSAEPRWALICCYNTRRNDPYKDSRHPRYSYLEKWPDAKIKEVGRQQWAEMQPAGAAGRA